MSYGKSIQLNFKNHKASTPYKNNLLKSSASQLLPNIKRIGENNNKITKQNSRQHSDTLKKTLQNETRKTKSFDPNTRL